jgi:hypothetical protein
MTFFSQCIQVKEKALQRNIFKMTAKLSNMSISEFTLLRHYLQWPHWETSPHPLNQQVH